MHVLNQNQIQLVSAGCAACPLAPGICITMLGITLLGTFFGWGKVITFTSAVAGIGLVGYMYLNSGQSDGHEHI